MRLTVPLPKAKVPFEGTQGPAPPLWVGLDLDLDLDLDLELHLDLDLELELGLEVEMKELGVELVVMVRARGPCRGISSAARTASSTMCDS